MSGFAADWLALREPVDAHARSPQVVAAVEDWVAQRCRRTPLLTIVDLAAGTGSLLRWLGPRLGALQHWRLADHDADLLARVDQVQHTRALTERGLVTIETCVADLAGIDLAALTAGADLVSASALLDLVSEDWCRRLVNATAGRAALYLTLSYDGSTSLAPADPLDARVRAAFNRHQRRDKGFGPALGPAAADAMAALLATAGAVVHRDRSDWRLSGPPDLLCPLITGWAAAAAEEAPEDAAAWRAWAERRSAAAVAGQLAVTVGHVDLFAVWPDQAGGSAAGSQSSRTSVPSA